jgi:hypothetical protein
VLKVTQKTQMKQKNQKPQKNQMPIYHIPETKNQNSPKKPMPI